MEMKPKTRTTGFTLIELLMVVGIIAILALIALPNLLDAQTRAKLARAKSDMRTIATALETYSIDNNNHYVPNYDAGPYQPRPNSEAETYAALTSPISYIASVPKDPFGPNPDAPTREGFFEYYADDSVMADPTYTEPTRAYWANTGTKWLVSSIAPDRKIQILSRQLENVAPLLYDASNGTISPGDIGRSNVVASLPSN
jgi:type II secretion system protein G